MGSQCIFPQSRWPLGREWAGLQPPHQDPVGVPHTTHSALVSPAGAWEGGAWLPTCSTMVSRDPRETGLRTAICEVQEGLAARPTVTSPVASLPWSPGSAMCPTGCLLTISHQVSFQLGTALSHRPHLLWLSSPLPRGRPSHRTLGLVPCDNLSSRLNTPSSFSHCYGDTVPFLVPALLWGSALDGGSGQ